ncbi:MAG: hypothetical protein N2V78_04500 [Methanophagales archaeon]|nr:hypothetical protein [Methanophagales archaeon]MCW3141033.1 hypothetical protein [Methanophagales archaeon]
MNEVEITRLMKDLMKLFQNISNAGFEEGEMRERFDAIKRELGSWFKDGYPLYQGS